LDEGLNQTELNVEKLDKKGKENMQELIRELWAKFENANPSDKPEAQKNLDKGKSLIETEYDISFFKTSEGIKFKHRPKLEGDAEKARINTKKLMDSALADIKKKHPSLHSHLEHNIRTGANCQYYPALEHEPKWIISWG